MKNYFLIAGILISVEAPYELHDDEGYSRYRVRGKDGIVAECNGDNSPEAQPIVAEGNGTDTSSNRKAAGQCYEIRLIEDMEHPPLEGTVLFQNEMNLFLEKDGEVQHFFCIPLTRRLAAWCETTGETSLTIHYRSFARRYFQETFGCFNAVSFEYILFFFRKFMLHCSYVDTGGEAVLFTAHSGGGKTTHGLLWEKSGLGEMINGDRAVLEKQGTTDQPRYFAHGLPIAGSSKVFKNRSLPLRAIFLLEKAPVNEVVDLPPSRKFMRVFEQITIHTWDREFANAVTNFVADLIQEVPVRLLRCRPDFEAVETVREALRTSPA